jgi:acetate kinase
MKVILAINAGSGSVKISVYLAEYQQSPQRIAEAEVNDLTASPPRLSYSRGDTILSKDQEVEERLANQDSAFRFLLQMLIDDENILQIKQKTDINFACHRVVHGGEYRSSQIITRDTYNYLEELSDLAPLHNGPALNIIRSCIEQLPKAVNIAWFDSVYHAAIGRHIYTYPINPDVAESNRLRKYGFHGLSYAFIAKSVAAFLDKPEEKLNIIALHLGSGASACAIKNGKSWNTSMGLTPLAGLPGATRSGDVDPR